MHIDLQVNRLKRKYIAESIINSQVMRRATVVSLEPTQKFHYREIKNILFCLINIIDNLECCEISM